MRLLAQLLLVFTIFAFSACAEDQLLGSGTDGAVDDAAEVADAAPATDSTVIEDATGAGADADAGTSTGEDARPAEDARIADAAPLDGAVDPGPPAFPATIDVLTLAVRTGTGTFDGTDANMLSLCLTATRCFDMNAADVDDFRRGEVDSYQFEGVALPRSAVDRVEIRSAAGTNAWRPSCLELRFDGEPVYCENGFGDILFGNAGGELTSWIDPLQLHQDCTTCWPSTLTHGPMIGGPDADRLRVWVRTDATRRVGLKIAGTVVDYAYPSPRDDYAVTLEAVNLQPSQSYLAGIEIDGRLIEELPAITAPALSTSGRTKIAFGSCSRLDDQPIFSDIAARAPDLFLFIGDNHYGNTADLDSLRWFYRWGLERPERSAFVRQIPVLATWDDHDFVGNNTTGAAPGKERALRAFREYWPNPAAGTPATPGVFFSHRRGDIDIFMLDDRYYRELDGSLLGAAQTAWLLSELDASTATFKLLVSGSQFTQRGSNDSWASFPVATEALFDHLRDARIDGVVLLSGDIHRSELRMISRIAEGGHDLPEITSSPLANTNSLCPIGADPELVACFASGSSYVVLDFETAVADPLMIATIYAENGDVEGTLAVRRSELTVP